MLRNRKTEKSPVDFDPQTYSAAESGDPPPSPCVTVCKMDMRRATEDGYLCAGCLRTIEEIAQWGTASNEVKLEIWRRIEERRLRHEPQHRAIPKKTRGSLAKP